MATLALVGNFIMSWAVDGTAPRARISGLPRIPLYYEDDLTTKKFIHTVDWYGYFPKDTSRRICPRGQVISLENPTNGMDASIKCKQSSVLCPLSVWKSQYLFLFLDSCALDIGGGVIKVPFSSSMESISLGVFVSGVNRSFPGSLGHRLKSSFRLKFCSWLQYTPLLFASHDAALPSLWYIFSARDNGLRTSSLDP
ncbi:hypothetical protein Tco_1141496 [Tanacetum coccineum]